jgi:hypothetical protein
MLIDELLDRFSVGANDDDRRKENGANDRQPNQLPGSGNSRHRSMIGVADDATVLIPRYFLFAASAARLSAVRAMLSVFSMALLPSWHAYSNI